MPLYIYLTHANTAHREIILSFDPDFLISIHVFNRWECSPFGAQDCNKQANASIVAISPTLQQNKQTSSDKHVGKVAIILVILFWQDGLVEGNPDISSTISRYL